jgi:hypothetical protein
MIRDSDVNFAFLKYRHVSEKIGRMSNKLRSCFGADGFVSPALVSGGYVDPSFLPPPLLDFGSAEAWRFLEPT